MKVSVVITAKYEDKEIKRKKTEGAGEYVTLILLESSIRSYW